LNALQMTVVPLVAALMVLGVNSASDAAASGRIARNALVVFVVLLTLAATFAAFLAPALFSILPRDDSKIAAIRAALEPVANSQHTASGLGEALVAIIPSNAIAAAANSAMLPLVTFALFFGFGLTRIDRERRTKMLDFIQTISETMIVIVRWVLWAAPLGVFALVLAVCARVGSNLAGEVGYYIVVQSVMYLSVTLLLYVVARVFGGEPFRRFAAAILPAQVVAMSTQSSLASMPAMIDSARERLGYPLRVTSLVLPMAVSLFRITSPVQYIGVAFFIAVRLYGIDVSATHIAIGIAMSVIISMGSVGLPGQVSFMATNLPVTQAMALPLEPLSMLMAVDALPDVFATTGNVSGDLTATSVVAKMSKDDDGGQDGRCEVP
jgi:Na+/H+-dicarboxylate symporter